MARLDGDASGIEPAVRTLLASGDESALRGFLLDRSRLPGPRANLELAAAFARAVESVALRRWGRIRSLCEAWSGLSSEMAPTGRPEEFLVFCGIRISAGFSGRT